MKESISTTFVFYLIVTFVIVLIMIFVGSISYSKAYKVKNRIVEVIEKEQTYDETARAEIEDWLRYGGQDGNGIGYRLNTTRGGRTDCPSPEKYNLPAGAENVSEINNYEYCVYYVDDSQSGNGRHGYYYHVVAYMYFDLPIIDQFIKLPVEGETMTFTEINT